MSYVFVFFNDTATTEIYTLSLHDALPIYHQVDLQGGAGVIGQGPQRFNHRRAKRDVGHELAVHDVDVDALHSGREGGRSEEHTSELQSRQYLVCRLLLEKKKKKQTI